MTTGAARQEADAAARPDAVDLEGATGRGVRVGVVDSGWDRTQANPRVREGIGILGLDGPDGGLRTGDAHDRIGHGTAAADLVLRVAPHAEILPVRVFDRELETSPAVLAAGIRWAVDADVDVLNLSLGTAEQKGVRTLYAACEYARRRGVVIVAANARDGFSSPAIFENAIGVGILNGNNSFRIEYREGNAVECLANSMHTDVLWLDGDRRVAHGTSFAAPIVTGLVARIRERHPGLPLEGVRRMLPRCREVASPVPTFSSRGPWPLAGERSEDGG